LSISQGKDRRVKSTVFVGSGVHYGKGRWGLASENLKMETRLHVQWHGVLSDWKEKKFRSSLLSFQEMCSSRVKEKRAFFTNDD